MMRKSGGRVVLRKRGGRVRKEDGGASGEVSNEQSARYLRGRQRALNQESDADYWGGLGSVAAGSLATPLTMRITRGGGAGFLPILGGSAVGTKKMVDSIRRSGEARTAGREAEAFERAERENPGHAKGGRVCRDDGGETGSGILGRVRSALRQRALNGPDTFSSATMPLGALSQAARRGAAAGARPGQAVEGEEDRAKGGRVRRKDGGGAMDKAQDKKMVTKAIHEHDKQMHGGKGLTKLKLRKGGKAC